MERRRYKNMFFIITFMTSIYVSDGCQMDGVTNWLVPISTSILDIHRGIVLERSTSSIESINSISYGEGTNGGPYLDVSYGDSRFVITTNDAYENYEENETMDSMSITVTFRCAVGSSTTTRSLVLSINVIDTNNNAPQFRPSDQYVFTVAPPLPPGFMITGCFNDIIVRDIDLTTQRIDFGIEDNPYFEIDYDAASSTVAKEFRATLRTKTFIRSLPEPVTVIITATDVDQTNDPPLSTNATITIAGDTDFEFPEEPVFSQAFYIANYTDAHYLVLLEPITLQSGYHETVQFTLDGEYANNFEIVQNGNLISLNVIAPLSIDAFAEKQTFLVVRADREFTSGGSATVIVTFPEDVVLQFERAHYEGTVENNILQIPPLVLTQGYESGPVSAVVISDYSTYFNAIIERNTIILTMSPLSENIIEENSFLNLQVNVEAARSTATAIVTLDIIKDDNVTPVFNKPIYEGLYNSDTGLTLEQIVLVQGYDETVSVFIEGDYAEHFQLIQNGSVLTLSVSTIPPEIFAESRILLSIEATKPRTVGANAAVIITLPAAKELNFEESTYRGTLQDNVINLQPIVLREGFDENVIFSLTGDHASYFSLSNIENVVSLSIRSTIPESIILENNIIILDITASGLNALTTTASVLLDVIKDDVTTPVFSSNIYVGNYISSSQLDIGDINLIQGFDDTVTFRIDGNYSTFFQISNTGNSVALSLRFAVPDYIIFNQKVLLLNIIAEKPLTVGANAAILIRFPTELTDSAILHFSEHTYMGTMENNVLMTEDIVLSVGYSIDIEFLLEGEYSAYFSLMNVHDVVLINYVVPLPREVVENNRYIVLEIGARRVRAVTVWTSLVIDIVKQEVIPSVFSNAFYTGIYSNETGLQFGGEISLSDGYDDSVSFELEGEFASYFNLIEANNSATLTTLAPLPERVLEDNSHLLLIVSASKPNAVTARATISIDILKNATEIVILRFAENSYVGAIQNNQLQLPTITLNGTNDEDVNLDITGDYAYYFSISRQGSEITLLLTNNLPSQVTEENTFITLELSASYPGAVSGFSTIVIEIIKEQIEAVVFERSYYIGEYSVQTGLMFEHTISLVEGFDETVSFTLDGDDARWFTLVWNEPNNLSLIIVNESGFPENRSYLEFSVIAMKPNSLSTYAPIIISITDFSAARHLQFSQRYYMGTLEGINLTLDSLSLEGYTDDVIISLMGDFANYFQLTNQGGGTFRLELSTELPDEIASSKVLILTVEAEIENTRTHATIVFEILSTFDIGVDIGFEEAFYIGTYSVQEGLDFDSQIRLAGENNSSVSYALQGNHAQWFDIAENEDSIKIILINSIPVDVLENNSHLIFYISAESLGSTIAQATIIISIAEDSIVNGILRFDNFSYIGTLSNDTVELPPIVLSQGYDEDVTFVLFGGLIEYFRLEVQGSVVTLTLHSAIPEELMPTNRIIVLNIQASAPHAFSTSATILLEVVEEDSMSVVQPVFNEPYYTGSYNDSTGLLFDNTINLIQGYDTDVNFSLEGENSQWFSLVQVQNSLTLTLSSPIPTAVLAGNRQLIFVITAQRPGSDTARSAIIITFTTDCTEELSILGFDRVTYMGSIQNNISSIGPMTLIEGFTDDVSFRLFGELSSYFSLTSHESVVTVSLATDIPEELIQTNQIVLLEIQASAPQAVSAVAAIVLEIVKEDTTSSIQDPVFDETYYTGTYSATTGLIFDTPITLNEGYDTDVQFGLEGENSQWFYLVQSQNSVTLTLSSPIPAAVLTNNRQLIFLITAQRTGSNITRATIVITLTYEFVEDYPLLAFDRITYVGSIQSTTVNVGPITLIEGYNDNVTFTILGELSNYFNLVTQGSMATIALQSAIPEQLVPGNRIIVLEIQASAPQAVPAFASIVLEMIIEDDATLVVQPVFDQAYYTGSYSANTSFVFDAVITLTHGHDTDVEFSLEGEHSQWFDLTQTQNIVTLTLSAPIPAAVLAYNRQLIFTIIALRPGSLPARSTIVITITDDNIEEMPILGFDRVTYVGSIQGDTTNIGTITLIEGYTDNVTFRLFGGLSNYFTLTTQNSVVTVALQTAIPEHIIPTNRIIVLEIQASAPQTVSATATIVFEVIEDEAPVIIQAAFEDPYYTGSYNSETGLIFDTAITLSQGYTSDIQFNLQGQHSQWFSLEQTENSVQLILSTGIPAAVLANNRQLIFVITAQTPVTTTALSTIIISLTNDYIEDAQILGFDRLNYIGTIEDNSLNIGPITLIEGYSENVSFILFGDLSNFFRLTAQDSIVSISLEAAIPEELIPSNRIVVLEIQASAPQASSTSATIVFDFVLEDNNVIQPVFNAAFYTGIYNATTGLEFETAISLSEGYGTDIEFGLEGENSQWFSLIQNQNSVTLTVTTPISAAVLANNRQLVFLITAQRPESSIARSTIIITISADLNENASILGFDRVTYVGFIKDNTATIGPITLIEGYTDDVSFRLFGELSSHFSITTEGTLVTVELQSAIPEQQLPVNGIVVVEIQASAPQAISASATLIFEVIKDEIPAVVQPVFEMPYYTGSYNTSTGLQFETPITLAEGYGTDIQYSLEGESSQWFSYVLTDNYLTLILSSPIPAAILMNNRQLVFVITASRLGSTTAHTTIVITLKEDYTEETMVLGFDRTTYFGSIQDNTTIIRPITLIEGYTNDVIFSLFGDLSSYFSVTSQESVVTVSLETAIPEQLIPINKIIILEIQASAPQAVSASSVILLEVIVENDGDFIIQPVFNAPYYTGSFNSNTGLIFETAITLTQGYSEDVQFSLHGDQSQWFNLVQTENSVSLTLTSAIPAAVLTNNRQLVFVITAQRPGSNSTVSTIIISLTDDHREDAPILGFDKITYIGSIQGNTASIDAITLIEGYNNNVSFSLFGELSSYFTLTTQGSLVIVALQTTIPDQLLPANGIIVLEIQATAPQAISTFATVIFEVIKDETSAVVHPVFERPYYTGSYNTSTDLLFETAITLAEGYGTDIQYSLEGESSQWFSLVQTDNYVTLILSSPIPAAVLMNNRQLVFVITASKPGSPTARATIVITLTDDYTEETVILGFDRVTYIGSIQDNVANVGPITLTQGYANDISFSLFGDLSSYFSVIAQGSAVTVLLQATIPEQLIPTNRIIVLELQASAPEAIPASAVVILEVIFEENEDIAVGPVFKEPYYTGSFSHNSGLVFDTAITLAQGYSEDVQFSLQGEQSQWFSLVQTENSVTLTLTSAIPAAVLANNYQLIFAITAQRPGSSTALSTIIISLTDDYKEEAPILGFDRITYMGSIEGGTTSIDPITLVAGFTQDVTFRLFGDLADYFSLTAQNAVVRIALQTSIPEQLVPTNRIIVLEIQASALQAVSAYATIVFEVIVDDDSNIVVAPTFNAAFYTGSYNADTGLVFETPITLSQGYGSDVQFSLDGESSGWFTLVQNENSLTLTLSTPIPSDVLANNRKLVNIVTAQRQGSSVARAVIIISLINDLQTGSDVSFEKVFYEGIIQNDNVQHESIRIPGYTGTSIAINGEYSSLFVAHVADGVVTVQMSGSLNLPADVTSLPLELHAVGDRAVLLLTPLLSGVPALPSVTFSSPLYALSVELVQTGLVGRVQATADNGETLIYSLLVENAHLQSRIFINNEGELHLSAPANSGVYSFRVIATTMITQATATATVQLTVEAITMCGQDTIVVPPLIILDRDEEEPHQNLVVLNTTQYPGCEFTLTSRWPQDQTWLYVDENGLHTTAIDREHQSIAFMALSQVQVELLLHCDADITVRTKRSQRTDWLGPYDYGTNKWILTDTILYNSRRSIVNLIVNDINDNAPIFIGKENEPIAVGYPTEDLAESILPRSLVELQATDADVGENAELMYWSSEDNLAVSPSTGFVHLRSGAQLEENQALVVHATDRNGEGLTGSIQLLVKLLDKSNIIVMTIGDAFLDDEKAILAKISEAVGYDVKSLRSVVISEDMDENDNSRKKRDTVTAGASLQLYVYGLMEREPVAIDRLTADINNNAASVANVITTLSLEDHLEGCEICVIPGRDTGLLVATIVLSVLLFIIIVLAALWLCLKWRKNRKYEEFSDENSLASRNDSVASLPKSQAVPKPRLNIEELRKSEKRLQEMLNSPVKDVSVEPKGSKKENPLEAILDLSPPETQGPIVIQSIDKLKDAEDDSEDDEFGQTNESRRKSVVTFNENVEKIIHVEDNPDEPDINEHPGYEIYKL